MWCAGSPIIIVRKQLPLKHAYAITANKAQGQTLERVLFDARIPAFSGGQLYVVCSRVRCRAAFGAVVGAQNVSGNKTVLAANVVYTELLDVISDCGAQCMLCE